MKTFTKQFMSENKGCYDEAELLKCSFMAQDTITLQSILDSEIKLRDKYWFVCKKLLTKSQNLELAIGASEIVLEIYEKKYPDNKAPREAIQAAKDYLAGVISLDVLRRKRTAYAAYAAAYAADAYAAYAADAYAAYAAATAAYAAATAADAAATATDAAAYAAAKQPDKKFTDILLKYLKDFCEKNVEVNY